MGLGVFLARLELVVDGVVVDGVAAVGTVVGMVAGSEVALELDELEELDEDEDDGFETGAVIGEGRVTGRVGG